MFRPMRMIMEISKVGKIFLRRERDQVGLLCILRVRDSDVKLTRPRTVERRPIRFAVTHWAHQDSNLEPRDYESPALPLSYGPEDVSILASGKNF